MVCKILLSIVKFLPFLFSVYHSYRLFFNIQYCHYCTYHKFFRNFMNLTTLQGPLSLRNTMIHSSFSYKKRVMHCYCLIFLLFYSLKIQHNVTALCVKLEKHSWGSIVKCYSNPFFKMNSLKMETFYPETVEDTK